MNMNVLSNSLISSLTHLLKHSIVSRTVFAFKVAGGDYRLGLGLNSTEIFTVQTEGMMGLCWSCLLADTLAVICGFSTEGVTSD